ncbi:hypothetical protein [Streptomyces sp. XY332]|uniref:hypothetical protein n=1 Tax=Streptomyces sp. XY332 TaxID=1415561 RepID=UPI0006B1CC33|nr:hypothetical protein [Streptomyces sp. XY332]KOY55310.1 hypothetical protein ADK59_25335 [Streptomyces sp. XY332]
MAVTRTRRIVPALMVATALATGGVSLSSTAFAAPSAAPANITTDADDPGLVKFLKRSKLEKISKGGDLLTKVPAGGGATGGDTEPPKGGSTGAAGGDTEPPKGGGGTGAATGGDTGTSSGIPDDFDYGVWVGVDPRSGPIVN